ncbi:MAG TPA: hypothetical protein VNN25_19585 [Thermoanaerobaculia bacterium]|nr:hypothetical protein [Thermoanaerobaculia bacterium]
MSKKYDPPKPGVGDAAQAITKAAVSAVPLLGGPAAELVNAVFTPMLERRRQEWMEQVAEALRTLEDKRGIPIEELKNNEVFGDTVLQATQIALRTSQDEKRAALRNAAINAALPTAPAQSLQQMFLSFIDVFTVWHIRILKLFDAPEKNTVLVGARWPNLMMGGMAYILENAYPKIAGNRGFYDQVWRDLYSRGLVNTESLHSTMSAQGLAEQRTSGLGREFIEFISEPV